MLSGDVTAPRWFTTEVVKRLSWPATTWLDGTATRASMMLRLTVVTVAFAIPDTGIASPDVEFRNP